MAENVSTYSDIGGHWAEQSILKWSESGLVGGYEGKFRPNDPVTRGETAQIMTNLLGLSVKAANTFKDLSLTEWYADPVLKCAAAGIMTGDGQNCNATANLTRQEAMLILGKALAVEPDDQPALSQFKDKGLVADWAAKMVSAMVRNGFVTGKGDGILDPLSSVTRAEIITILNSAIGTYITKGGTYQVSGEGIVLVAAKGVTLSGKADKVIIAQGAASGTVVLDDLTADCVLVTADGVKIQVDGSSEIAEMEVAEGADAVAVEIANTAEVKKMAAQPDTDVVKKPVSVGGSGGSGSSRDPVGLDAIANVAALETGASTLVTVVTDPADAAVTVESSAPAVAAAAVEGHVLTITGVAEGTATITVTAAKSGYKTKSTTFTVTVVKAEEPIPVPVTVEPIADIAELEAGSGAQVTVVTTPADASLVVESSNPDVATVQASGHTLSILGVAEGTAAITVTASKEGWLDASVTFNVAVTETVEIKVATGATVTKEALLKENKTVSILDFGAKALEDRAAGDKDTYAIENTQAINAAIAQMAAQGGGTVLFPAGTFRSYTIELKSNVNLYLDENCVVQAASPGEDKHEDGSNGNYLQPEVNIYAGLQDGGHTYFANSLLYAADEKNIMIYGEGRLDGSQMRDDGTLTQVLNGNDPGNPSDRTGQTRSWYGNKAIALVRCENIVLADFDILNGGHFAIIMEGTRNMLVDGMIIDTNRDAFNIDCGQDVTIQNSHFNSLTDDAIVFKASYGAGLMMPTQNCLVRDCIVSGYDAGSVLAGTYTTDKQVATDACGPTARIKFGTESTCGYNTVTITNVKFERSRGFCLESVDGNALHDIILTDCEMDTVSSSPIYIRIGNRGRHPVTGNSTSSALSQGNNVRLTNNGWIIPQNSEEKAAQGFVWTEYPIQRYFPAYNTNSRVKMSNGVNVSVVNQDGPVRLNPNNYYYDEESEAYYGYKWDTAAKTYVVDYSKSIKTKNADGVDERYYYGDAVGFENLATVYNIYVGNVKITNVDPRYPITLAGLVDSKIENVIFENIDITYRGGMRMADAVEQQQLSTRWNYTQYMTAPTTQNLPWLVNTFFAKNAALLPRVTWDAASSSWVDDPYNVPEMPEQYPEPSNFGILPAYGLYARHVDGLELINVNFGYQIDDERHAVVLDDCQDVDFTDFTAEVMEGVETVALVSNNYKRHTSSEYVPNEPYFQTTCEDITGIEGMSVLKHTVNAPEPSTPKDDLYKYDTIASPDNGYSYGKNVWTYNGIDFNLPVTVYRPFFSNLEDKTAYVGKTLTFTVNARNPAAEVNGTRDQAAADATLTYHASDLPAGAKFDSKTKTFTWTPAEVGEYQATFTVVDGVLPVTKTITIKVERLMELESIKSIEDLEAGSETVVNVVSDPADAVLTAESNDPSVASVRVEGGKVFISGGSVGTAIVTVTASKDGYVSQSVSFAVTVTARVDATSATVIVRKGEAPNLLVVGTSSVTVKSNTTVSALLNQIKAKDGSRQSYRVLTADGAVKAASDVIVQGDQLEVVSSNGKAAFINDLFVKDALNPTKEYWDDETYAAIDELVNANTPTFRDVDYLVTSEKYQALVADMEEEYYVVEGRNAVKKTQTVKNYTPAIQTAINDASAAGGGRVVIPAAEGASAQNPTVYYTGSIEIKSDVNLHIEENVVLKFVRNISNEYYPMVLSSFEGNDTYNYASPIRAFHARNIALTGKGTLDFQADSCNWLPWKSNSYGLGNQATVVDVLVKQWSDQAVPVQYRILTDGVTPPPAQIPTMDIDWDDITKVTMIDTPTVDVNGEPLQPLKSLLRPCAIEPYACENVLIEGVRIINSPMWEVHPLRCRNVLVRGLDIDSHGSNNDGCNPESTRNVVIEDCRFDTGDDCIAIKSGKNRDGYSRGQVGGESSENIIVRNCNFAAGHGGVTCGSEVTGGVRNVFATDNQFNSPSLQQVLRFKTNSYRGGLIENIYFKDSTVIRASKALMYGETQYTAGSAQDKEGDLGPYTPQLRNVYMSNITAGSMEAGVGATDAIYYSAYERAPMTDIHVKDVTIYGVKNEFRLNIVKNFELDNVKIAKGYNSSTGATTGELVTYNTVPHTMVNATITVEGEDYSLTEGIRVDLPEDIDKTKKATVSGVIATEDAKFAAGSGTVKVYMDRGILRMGQKAPVITPYTATVTPIGQNMYVFTVDIPLTDKPNYQYPYRPETQAENMLPGNHILSIVATGEGYQQNTWNYNVIADSSKGYTSSTEIVNAGGLSNIKAIGEDYISVALSDDFTVGKLLKSIHSADGTYQCYVVQKAGSSSNRGDGEKIAVGDKLIVQASDGQTRSERTFVTEDAMTDAQIKLAGSASEVKEIDAETHTISVKYGTTVAQLKAQIVPVAAGAGFQSYEVSGKADDTLLATGDKLIVTARDGSTKQEYTVVIYKENQVDSSTEIEAVPGSKVLETGATKIIVAKNTTAAEVLNGVTSALGGKQTYAVYAGSELLDGSAAVAEGCVLEVTAQDGVTTKQYTIEIKRDPLQINLMTLFNQGKLTDYGTSAGSTYPNNPPGVKGIDNGSSYFRFMDDGGAMQVGTYFDFEITLEAGRYTAGVSGGKANTSRGKWEMSLIPVNGGQAIPFGQVDTSLANAVDFDGEAQQVPAGTYKAHFVNVGRSGTAGDFCLKYLVFTPMQADAGEEPEPDDGEIKVATGATVTKEALLKENKTVSILDFGAKALEDRAAGDKDTYAIENTQAINAAIAQLAAQGGGTVLFPAGTFRSYTIELKSNVNLYLDENCVVQAASPGEDKHEDGSNGNYLQPEVNIYAGLQDGGHTYFANSLLYAADEKNIMIYGEGRLDGSQMRDDGTLTQVLNGNDPGNPSDRTGQTRSWYGNKAIALVRCENIVLADFDILNGGHFAIIMEGTRNMLVDGMIIDTNRDAFNIDCGQDVTIQNSHFNSLTDDAIVFKASYGAGLMMPTQNCLVRDCIVSGYDAGSVLAGTYTTDKQVATDACGPTARIKFGTESTCGYNTVTITNVKFERSRGFCLESVDGNALHDIILTDCEMDTVSSSPIYIRIGNRGRHPVTGNSTSSALSQGNNVRLTNNGWIIPQNSEEKAAQGFVWTEYPIQRYFPAYNTNSRVKMSNGVNVSVVNQDGPVRLNPNNYYYDEESEAYYGYKWDTAAKTYVVDYSKSIKTKNADGVDERYYYGDAVGFENLATVYNIYVGNVKITNVDPRYPITLAGLVDSKIENVIFENIDITYRGGMRMADAVEQQQLSTRWNYTQYMTAPTTQNLPWLVNTFFAKNAALLPRVTWDAASSSWVDDPYNVPEMPEQYPEPSNFGILPAYGLYARHVDGLELINVNFGYQIDDERHAVVLDDCQDVDFTDFTAEVMEGVETVALVSNNYKRHTSSEYVPNEPYFQTTCEDITGIEGMSVLKHTVNAPEPSTPKDDLYKYDTIASPDNGYSYGKNVWTYNGIDFNLPVTVYRPFFSNLEDCEGQVGKTLTFTVNARNPAAEVNGTRDQAAADATLTYYVSNLPAGAKFDSKTKTFTWTPEEAGEYQVTFTVHDGVLPVSKTITIAVKEQMLTYNVTEGLDFGDTGAFETSDEAWDHAEKVVTHVESTVEDMRAIFAQRSVTITDAPYGAQASEDYQNALATKAQERELAIKNTKAIYAAIKDVSEAGGGTVVVPAVEGGKVFYTSAIHLEDNVNLHIEKGAELKFTTDTDLYCGELMKEVYGDDVDDKGLTLTRFESVELMGYSPFIYAYGKKNIAITGEGTIDGQASNGKQGVPEWYWHQWKSTYTYTLPDGSTKRIQAQAAPRTKLFAQGQNNVPVAERQYGESASEEWSGADDGFLRPNFVQPYNCQNVLIEGIRVEGSPMWELNIVLCDTVMVQDVYVESHMSNNDGCNPEASSNVVIQDSYFDVGDDCIAIKSGRNGDGLRIGRASFNVVIQDNTFVDGHGGVTIGSEITGGVKNIFARNNMMESNELQCAYRFKTNYIRGGVIENIFYKDDTVKMVQSSKPVILVDLNYDISSEVRMMTSMGVDYTAYVPQFKNVVFEGMKVNEANVKGNGGRYALQLNGFNVSGIDSSATILEGTEDCYITDFTIKNSTFVGCQQAFNMTNVDGLTMENVTITGSTTADRVNNCKNLSFLDCDFRGSVISRDTFEKLVNMDLTGTKFEGDIQEVEEGVVSLNWNTYAMTCGRSEAEGETITLTAEFNAAPYEDPKIVWESSDSTLAELTPKGSSTTVRARTTGFAEVTAKLYDGETLVGYDVCELVIIDGYDRPTIQTLDLSAEKLTIQAGAAPVAVTPIFWPVDIPGDGKLNTTLEVVESESYDPAIASAAVVDGSLVVTPVAAGQTTITVKSPVNGRSASCVVTVTGDELGVTGLTADTTDVITMDVGDTQQLKVTAVGTAEADLIWTSSNAYIVSVDKDGVITARSTSNFYHRSDNTTNPDVIQEDYGTVTITATSVQGGYTASFEVMVNDPEIPVHDIDINVETINVALGGEAKYLTSSVNPAAVLNPDVAWASSDPSVLKVEVVEDTIFGASQVELIPVKAGKAKVSASYGGLIDTCEVTVTDGVVAVSEIEIVGQSAIERDQVIRLTAEVTGNATEQKVYWLSTDRYVATVDRNGYVKGYEAGEATIYAIAQDSVSEEELETYQALADLRKLDEAALETLSTLLQGVVYNAFQLQVKDSNHYLRNLQAPVEGVTYESVALLWNRDSLYVADDLVSSEVAVNGAVVAELGNEMGYTVKGLRADTSYVFTVTTYYGEGESVSESIEVTTKQAPTVVLNVLEAPYNAVGDGSTLDTAAIQAAINDCPVGGEVWLPADHIFYSGALFLKSDMTFRVDGILLGSLDPKDYPRMVTRWEGWRKIYQPASEWLSGGGGRTDNEYSYSSLLTLGVYDEGENSYTGPYNIENVVICGNGQINGNGYRLGYNEGPNSAANNGPNAGAKASPRKNATIRGRTLTMHNAKNIYVTDVMIANSPAWTIQIIYSDSVTVDNVSVVALSNYVTDVKSGSTSRNYILNGDGCDVDSSTNTNVINSFFRAGDDAIAAKNGKDLEGWTLNKPTAYLRVTDVFSDGSRYGVIIGSEMAGGAHDLLFQNLEFKDNVSDSSMWIKAPLCRGGLVEDIVYKDVFNNGGTPAIYAAMDYSSNQSSTPAPVNSFARRLTYENIIDKARARASSINGNRNAANGQVSYIEDVVVRGCQFANALSVQRVKDILIFDTTPARFNVGSNKDHHNVVVSTTEWENSADIKVAGDVTQVAIDLENKGVSITGAISVADLTALLQPVNQGINPQTYTVQGKEADNELVTGDVLVVTSSNGLVTQQYAITVTIPEQPEQPVEPTQPEVEENSVEG